jgi:hypothetical protein
MEEEIKPQKQEESEQSIIDKLFKEKDSYRQANQTQRETFSEIHDSYTGVLKDVKDSSKSQESTNKLMTEVSYIVPSIFSGNPEIEIEPIGEEDKLYAEVFEKIVNYQLETIPQAYEKIEAWVKQATVYGTSLMKVCWKFATGKNEDGSETPITDEADLDVPNILDCYYNPIIPNVENQHSLIFRSVLTLEEVKNNPIYDYTDQLGNLNREKVESGKTSSASNYDSSSQVTSDGLQLEKASEGTVEVYERITNEEIITVCDGKERLVLRKKPYFGFKNAVKLIHEPMDIPNRFEGYGVGHNTLGLGKLYQKMMNRTLDSVALTNNPFFLFKKGAKIDKKQMVVKPGGGIEVDGDKPLSEYIQAIQFPDIKQGALGIMNKIEDEHKRASGANDLMQGAASNKTLGQDQIASSYSSNRFELINRRFKQSLADVGDMLIQLTLKNIQSVDSPILRIFPKQVEVENGEVTLSRELVYQLLIAPEAQNVKYNIKVKGETNVAKNKDIQIKQLIDAYNLFGAILPPENQMEWARKILSLRGVDEIDKLVPSAEQLQQLQQQSMEQMPIDGQSFGNGMPQQPSEQLM